MRELYSCIQSLSLHHVFISLTHLLNIVIKQEKSGNMALLVEPPDSGSVFLTGTLWDSNKRLYFLHLLLALINKEVKYLSIIPFVYSYHLFYIW